MKKSFIIQITLMLLGILSFSSCSDDSANEPFKELQINLSKEDAIIEIGSTIRLTAGFSPADASNKAHTWTSENPQIATVDESGIVTGVSVGTTKIVATALANNATATCIVEVVDKIIAVASVTLNSSKETITVGSTTQLTATIKPATATDKKIVWRSNDNSVASVDENGLVKGLSVGSANITALAGGKSAVCAITVTEKSVDFSDIEYTVQADGTLLVSGTVTPIGVNVSEIGICFSTETTPTVETDKHVLTTTGLEVHNEIGGLKANTSYYARMYAKGDGVIYYGKSEVIKIPGELKTQFKLVENSYKDYGYNDKTYSMTISTPKVEGYDCSFCYGVAPNPEITDNVADPTTEGDLQIIKLENLSGATRYYIRAYSLKNNKPIYHSGEASFSTIGAETKLSATWLDSYRCKIDYSLNEKGTYEVTLDDTSGAYIGKTEDAIQSKTLYVNEGSGSIYAKFTYYYHGTIIFENIDSGTLYKIYVTI